jgi:hypothetical protein
MNTIVPDAKYDQALTTKIQATLCWPATKSQPGLGNPNTLWLGMRKCLGSTGYMLHQNGFDSQTFQSCSLLLTSMIRTDSHSSGCTPSCLSRHRSETKKDRRRRTSCFLDHSNTAGPASSIPFAIRHRRLRKRLTIGKAEDMVLRNGPPGTLGDERSIHHG